MAHAALALLLAGGFAAPAAAQTRVLVDASKDGGVWWFPQSGPFDPTAPHQGRPLAEYLRALGMVVDETPRPETITCDRLSQYHVVVAFGACDRHSPEELRAYAGYLARGGRLILLGEHSCFDCVLAHSLGVEFGGSLWGTVAPFTPHPITAGVTELPYQAGGVIGRAPSTATMLGWVDGEPVMGIMPVGEGRAFFLGDTSAFLQVRQPFVDNLFTHMLDGAAPVDACVPETTPGAPSDLVVDAVQGRRVTMRFLPPAHGAEPTGYVLKGGLSPGEVLAAVPTGTTAPVFSFDAPEGSFFVRLHTRAGAEESAASNEVPLHVGERLPPFAPERLLGLTNGSEVTLAWRNSYVGGPPSGIVLDVSGSIAASIPLGLTDRFVFPAVPDGVYTLALRAINANGTSWHSNALTLQFPGACSGAPLPVANFLAYRQGAVIAARWDSPASGPAPTSYELNLAGAYTGSFETVGRVLSGSAGPGAYRLSVRARNACGVGAFTPEQVVVVP